jgi:hypothetical protein
MNHEPFIMMSLATVALLTISLIALSLIWLRYIPRKLKAAVSREILGTKEEETWDRSSG